MKRHLWNGLLLSLLAGCGSSAAPSPDAGLTPDAASGAVIPDAAAGADAAGDANVSVEGPPPLTDGAALEAGGETATFVVDWSLVRVGSATAVTCKEAGTPQVRFAATPAGGGGLTYGGLIPCDQHPAHLPMVPAGQYEVVLELRDAEGTVLSAIEGSFRAVAGGETDLGVVAFQIQSFELHWSLSHGGQASTCEAAGATTVELVTRLAMEPEVGYSFPCDSGQGITPAIRLGTYQVTVRVLGALGRPLWQTDTPMTVNVTGTERAVLPPVVINL
jgi:hypothetical protein